MKKPTKAQIDKARAEIAAEDKATQEYYESPEVQASCEENNRRANLPSEHPDHICGIRCDGQDGWTSYCARLRIKLFGRWH